MSIQVATVMGRPWNGDIEMDERQVGIASMGICEQACAGYFAEI
jgi:hypothetical protein